MRSIFEQWKYIFRNLWFVLPFAVVPCVFISLLINFKEIEYVGGSLFSGPFELQFREIFYAWSIMRFDSPLGIICSILAIICLVFFSAALLIFVEKHMRIGKRTLSGIPAQLGNHLFSFICFVLLMALLYEVWALILSAMLYMICSIASKTAARILFAFVSMVFVAALLYLITVIYLWLPCTLHTGFRAYNAFLYSYRLIVGARWRLYLSMLISFVPSFLILLGSAFGPIWLSRILAILLFSLCYLSFIVRMETLYFETDKLDREDLLRSYREL